MEKTESTEDHENLIPVAFSLPPYMKREIRKHALKETDGNKSKWMQLELEKIFADKKKEKGKKV